MVNTGSLTQYRLTDHAKEEMRRRQISEDQVARILFTPEQVEMIREGRRVHQSLIAEGSKPSTYLLRVFVDVDREPPEVVTVYRTSKISKYWRGEL